MKFLAFRGRRSGSLVPREAPEVPAPPLVGARSTIEEMAEELGRRRALWSYVILVLLPCTVYLLYASLFETRAYLSETRFTVQSAQRQRVGMPDASSMLQRIIGTVGSDTGRDTYIALNYVKSAAILTDLGGAPYLERFYAKKEIDWFSRLPTGLPIERLLLYWRDHVFVSIDSVSGILAVRVIAYDAADAETIARDVNRLSEALINSVSLRSRQDALNNAEAEVRKAGSLLATARERLVVYRNANQIIDPGQRAVSVGETIAKLTMERVEAEVSLDVVGRSLNDETPTTRLLRQKIETLDHQIANLKANLTAPKADGTVSTQIADFENLKLEEQFAEKVYVMARDTYLRARQELEKQQLYLVTVVPPMLPEEPTYPRVTWNTLMALVVLSILWSIGALIVASIDE